jgi:hypothetical protein
VAATGHSPGEASAEPARQQVVVFDTLPVPYSETSYVISGPARRLPWLTRSLLAGAAGAAAVGTLEMLVDRSPLPRGARGDGVPRYPTITRLSQLGDPSHRRPVAARAGYAAALGLVHGTLRRRTCEPRASLTAGAGLAALTVSLLSPLGRTPPPWRWRPLDFVYTSAVHTVYAVAVKLAHQRIWKLQTGYWTARLFD